MLIQKYQVVQLKDNVPATTVLFDRQIDAENYIEETMNTEFTFLVTGKHSVGVIPVFVVE